MNPAQLLQKLKTLEVEQLESIHGIGPILAQNIVDFTLSERFHKLEEGFGNLQEQNIDIQLQQTAQAEGVLSGKSIVITGEFDIPRTEIKKLIEAQGGKVSSSISKKTSYLLVGEKPGSKLAKAQKLGVTIKNRLSDIL